jgi:hypothetical protein
MRGGCSQSEGLGVLPKVVLLVVPNCCSAWTSSGWWFLVCLDLTRLLCMLPKLPVAMLACMHTLLLPIP